MILVGISVFWQALFIFKVLITLLEFVSLKWKYLSKSILLISATLWWFSRFSRFSLCAYLQILKFLSPSTAFEKKVLKACFNSLSLSVEIISFSFVRFIFSFLENFFGNSGIKVFLNLSLSLTSLISRLLKYVLRYLYKNFIVMCMFSYQKRLLISRT